MNNGIGVVGVSPGTVSLYIVRVFGNDGMWAYSSGLVDAAQRCANAGANIISMSLGGGAPSSLEEAAFTQLYAQGILSIAASGNSGGTDFSYPASYPAVVSVAAISSDKNIANFSTRNNQVDVAAPGVRVLSTTSMTNSYGQEVNRLSVDGAVYEANWITGAGRGSSSGVLVDGGICDAVGSSWSGKVVLCKRGTVSFATKVTNAKSGGGIAAVIYNNVAGNFVGTLNGVTSIIPAISLSLVDGQALIANNKIGLLATVISTSDASVGPYAYFDGTSMATPHVSGVAALVWSAKPSATNIEVREALIATAEDLGTPGRDDLYGHGLVKAKKAIDYLTSTTRTSSPTFSPTTNRPTSTKPTVSCSLGMSSVEVNILTDDWPSETTWNMTNQCNSQQYLSGGPYNQKLTVHSVTQCLPTGQYQFTINDSFGDGICCNFGLGSYTIVVDGIVIAAGGTFPRSDTKTFGTCVSNPPPTVSSASPTTSKPTSTPTSVPTFIPTSQPTTSDPTFIPTSKPTSMPTSIPTHPPTTLTPTSKKPTFIPSSHPTTSEPTSTPTSQPVTSMPSSPPSSEVPTSLPTSQPTTSEPTFIQPTTSEPTSIPTSQPVTSTPTSTPISVPTFNNSWYNPTALTCDNCQSYALIFGGTTQNACYNCICGNTGISICGCAWCPIFVDTSSPSTSLPTSSQPTTSTPTSSPSSQLLTSSPTYQTLTSEPTSIPTSQTTTSEPTFIPTFQPTTSKPITPPTTFTPTSKPTLIPSFQSTTLLPTSSLTSTKPTVSCSLGMNVEVNILTDDWPSETTWNMTNQCNGQQYLSGGPYNQTLTVHSVKQCLPTGQYQFTINDSVGDGICCNFGLGSYTIVVDGIVNDTGGSFLRSDTKTFGTCVGVPPTTMRPMTAKPTTRKPTTRKPTTRRPTTTRTPTRPQPTRPPSSRA